MRITCETTVSEPKYSSKAIIEKPYDDVSMTEFFEMCADLAEAMGFSGAKKYLEGEDA
jgi:hypothetical protein